MTLCKIFLLLALPSLVVGVVKKGEKNDNEQLETMPHLGPRAPSLNSQLVQIKHQLRRTEAYLQLMEKRVRSLEAHRVYQLRGRDGRDGLPGQRGKDGRDGRDGANGARGPQGPKGAPGSKGARGPRGPSGGGVQYVRWGKTSCTSGSSLVYKGRIGGEHYSHSGGGANYVCLTENPKYANPKNGFQHAGGRIYGTEYETSAYSSLFKTNLHDHEAPCAVCYVRSRSVKLMIPATYECPSGWRREYWGYLMTDHYSHRHSVEFICVDKNAEAVGSRANHNGALLYPVQGTCGALPCNTYKNGWEITCAVCTK